MAKRTPSTKRVERKPDRNGKRPAASTTATSNRPTRQRPSAARPAAKGGGGFKTINWVPILGAVAVLAVVGLIIYAVTQSSAKPGDPAWLKAENNSDASLPGVYYAPHPGVDGVFGTADDRDHLTQVIPIGTQAQIDSKNISSPLCYQSNPPTSGPHNPSPMPFKILDNPAPKENLVHNMEHGGVVVWYNTTNQDVIDQLKSVVQSELNKQREVVMSFYPDMEPDTVALTAWTRLDKFPASDFTKKRATDFIETHSRRFNPEGF